MKKVFSAIFLVLFVVGFANAQDSSNVNIKVVQITGLALGSDSLQPVPFADVIIKNSYRGTMCDFSGFFSIVAKAGDTLVFSSLGYKRSEYIIPDTLEEKQYSLIQLMDRDIIMLEVAEIRVWPTYEQFKRAFVEMEIDDSDLQRAKRNLDKEIMEEQAIALGLGAGGNQQLLTQNYNSALYNAGQVPTTNWLNPVAWAKFIDAWKKGEFSKKKKK